MEAALRTRPPLGSASAAPVPLKLLHPKDGRAPRNRVARQATKPATMTDPTTTAPLPAFRSRDTRRGVGVWGRWARKMAILCIRAYQLGISPMLRALCGPGMGCRFEPSCSHYAIEAVRRYGVRRGGWLAVSRLCRCSPWGGWGWDPVPEDATSAGARR
jgi:putative membrane protein insertion efficiency factor